MPAMVILCTVSVLGLLFANTAVVKIIIKLAMLDRFHYELIQVTNYKICNIVHVCWNKLTYMFLRL